MTKIIIRGELVALNDYIRQINRNRFEGNKIKRTETEYVSFEARKARKGIIKRFPVHITFWWYSKDRRRDIDNVAFAKKFILDGLVEAEILPDDSRRYITGFSDYFDIDAKDPRVEVEISSVGNKPAHKEK